MKIKHLLFLFFISSNGWCEEPLIVFYKSTEPYLRDLSEVVSDSQVKLLEGTGASAIYRYANYNRRHVDVIKVNSVSEIITNVNNTPNSIGIGAISINNERLQKVNFGIPYRITHTVLAYEPNAVTENLFNSVLRVMKSFFPYFIITIVFCLLLSLTGLTMGSSIWLSLVTSTTVGYGDIVPKTPIQKFLIGIWMLVSVYYLSIFTATLSAELTGNSEFEGETVGALYNTEGEARCRKTLYKCVTFNTYDDMFSSVANGHIDGVIVDKEIMFKFREDLHFKPLSNSLHSMVSDDAKLLAQINKFIMVN